jgi:hypothetical protein
LKTAGSNGKEGIPLPIYLCLRSMRVLFFEKGEKGEERKKEL